MVVTHEPWIVVLSILVAIQGAYVGLSLALELPSSVGNRRRLLLAGASVTLAVAIWSMHFVGVLAVRSPVRIDYLVLPTLISFLVCVVVVGFAVFLASGASHSWPVLVISAIVMGTGIVAMHFIGMQALHANAMMHHDPAYVVASFFIGVVASGLAIYFAFSGTVRPPLVAASIALGLAIAGMHYTAMAGMELHPLAGLAAPGGTTLPRDVLAVVVAVVAFGSSSAFLLALVPDETPAKLVSGIWQSGSASLQAETIPAMGDTLRPAALLGDMSATPVVDHQPEPPRQSAVLPVQKEGATHYLPVGRVLAVKAEAHYTTVFDGRTKYFCSLSITDIESRLGSTGFIRTHRSHIVAVDHIISLKRAGDGGVAHLDSPVSYSLPVSRRKLSQLRAILEART